jgi:hypothetical protein
VKHFPHEIVILPYKDIGIVRNTSESKLSFQQASYDFFLGQLTGMAAQEHAITEIVREGITKLLDRVYDVVDTEVIGAITTEIGICEGM